MTGEARHSDELAALRESEIKYRTLFETADDAIFLMDGNRFVECNPRAETMFGGPRERLLERAPAAHSPPLQADGTPSDDRARDLVARALAGVPQSFEWRHLRLDGTPFDAEVSLNRLDLGDRPYLQAIVRDVSRRRAVEAQLAEREAMLRHVTDAISDAVVRRDAAGRTVWATPSALRLLGFTAEAFARTRVADVVHPDDLRGLEESLLDVFAAPRPPLRVEFRVRDATGEYRWMESDVCALFRPDGGFDGTVTASRDVTERRRREDELREKNAALEAANARLAEREQLLGRLFDINPVGMSLTSWPDGAHLEVNPAITAIFGRSRDEMIGRTTGDIDGWVESSECAAWREALARDGSAHGRVTLRDASGRAHPCLMSSVRLELDGRPAVFSSVLDIMERHQAAEALREREETFRAIFELAPYAITIITLEGHLVDANRAFLERLGRAREDVVGRPVADVFGPHASQVMARVADAGEESGVTSREVEIPLGEGRSVWLLTSSRVIRLGGRPHVLTVSADITERRLQELELQRKTDELTRFTYAVSHDLKSPLVTIRTFLGYLEADLRAGEADRVAKDVGFIRNAAEKMAALLDELLALSRVGRVVNAPEDVPFREIVDEALALVAGRLASGQIEVTVEDAPILLHGDRARLREVFQNLVDNAAKFMGDQPAPRVRIGAEEGAGGWVLTVADNGGGVDPRHAHRLFGLFEKLHPGTEGTGVGLAMAKRIVELHGGHITLESPGPGQGTTVRFTLARTRRI